MILVDYRGKDDAKYIFVYDTADLEDCIKWMQSVLAKMKNKGVRRDSIIDLKDYKDGFK